MIISITWIDNIPYDCIHMLIPIVAMTRMRLSWFSLREKPVNHDYVPNDEKIYTSQFMLVWYELILFLCQKIFDININVTDARWRAKSKRAAGCFSRFWRQESQVALAIGPWCTNYRYWRWYWNSNPCKWWTLEGEIVIVDFIALRF